MGITKTVRRFYERVVSCSNTARQCPGIWKSVAGGRPPRGFYTEGKPGDIEIILVSKNPGHPFRGEPALFKGLSAAEIVDRHLQIGRERWQEGATEFTSIYHKNIARYLSFLLDLPPKKVFRVCLRTNLVKCSTKGEQDRLHSQTMRNCFDNFLAGEIALFNPKAIIAFGREAERFLKHPEIMAVHCKPVFYLKHPSYHYRKDEEKRVLSNLKKELARLR